MTYLLINILIFTAKREELDFSSLDPMIRVGTLGLVTDDNDFSSTQIRSSPPLLDGSEADETVTEMLADALRDLGYSSFRPGQVWNNNSLTIMVLTNAAMWDIKDYFL